MMFPVFSENGLRVWRIIASSECQLSITSRMPGEKKNSERLPPALTARHSPFARLVGSSPRTASKSGTLVQLFSFRRSTCPQPQLTGVRRGRLTSSTRRSSLRSTSLCCPFGYSTTTI